MYPLSRLFLLACVLISLLAGCKPGADADKAEHAYVIAPQVALRDRVAAVYNKVGLVANGDRVRVLDRSQNRRFVKVRTTDGREGWMEQRYLAGQEIFDGFAGLARDHASSPAQAMAVTRRPVNLHLTPARNGETLFQLKEATKVELLERASTPKSGLKRPAAREEEKDREDDDDRSKSATPGDPLEDWWLVRDPEKHVGWMLGRMLDIEIPLEIAQYAEGQRIIAAFVLSTVPESAASQKQVPQYAVLLSEPKDGLPFDFNQVRIFTWNPKKSRYETAYRERVNGHLPFRTGHEGFGREGTLPTFQFLTIGKDGMAEERKYKMIGPIVRKILKTNGPEASSTRPKQKH